MSDKGDSYKNLLGATLGKCRIDEFCFQGRLGLIFRGSHLALDREVAIKLLFESPGLDYFLEHTKQIVALEHSNIHAIYDISFDKNTNSHYVIAQWETGESLARILENNKILSIERALQIITDLAHTLAYAHQHDVVHGDLTPNNVFIYEESARIANFSLISCSDGKMGTPGYMAPEQERIPEPSFRSDIFNLGCIFYQMLIGKLPDFSKEDLERGEAISLLSISSFLKLPSHVPDVIASCLYGMLTPDPEKRIQRVEELVVQLGKLQLGFNKVSCPRCARENAADKVFQCQECGTRNLCLSHLVPEKRCCSSCLEVSQGQKQQFAFDRNEMLELSKTLRNIANNNKQGLLTFSNNNDIVALHIAPARIEICLNSSQKIESQKFACQTASEQEQSVYQAIVQDILAKIMEWKAFSCEFIENAQPENILPEHCCIGFDTFPGGFLISFLQVLQIHESLICGGTVLFENSREKISVRFTRQELAVAIGGENFEIIDAKQAISSVKQAMATVCKIQYYSALSLAKDISIIHFSQPTLLETLTKPAAWKAIANFLPELNSLLPGAAAKAFAGFDLSKLSEDVAKKLSQQLNSASEISGLSFTDFTLVKAAIAKDRLRRIGLYLVKLTEQYAKNWNFKDLQAILLEAQKLCPDLVEIPYQLAKLYRYYQYDKKAAMCLLAVGNIHWHREYLGLALADYQNATELDFELLPAKLRLLELYDRLEQKDKIREIGNGLLAVLRQNKGEKDIERVCRILLKADSGQAHCRRELIRLYRIQKNIPAMIAEYEALVDLYRRAKNKEGMAKAMANIVKLDRRRKDMINQLQKMGYKWKNLLEKPVSLFRGKKFCAGISLLLLLVIISLVHEWMGQKKAAALLNAEITLENVAYLKQQAQELALGLYFSDVNAQALTALKALEPKSKLQFAGPSEQRLWMRAQRQIDVWREAREWGKIRRIYAALENRFVDPKITAHLQRDKRAMLDELRDDISLLVAQAKQLEKQQNYAKAVDIYQQVLDVGYFQDLPEVENIKLPLLIESRPIQAICMAAGNRIGKTPQLLHYRPGAFPEIAVKRKGYRESGRELIKSEAGHVWKIGINIHYRSQWSLATGSRLERKMVLVDDIIYLGGGKSIHAVGVDGRAKWKFNVAGEVSGGLLLNRGKLYFGVSSGDLYALDSDSGKLLWKSSSQCKVRSMPTLCGQELCLAGEDGSVYFFSLDGKLKATLKLEGSCYNSPVAFGRDKIFVATSQGNIYSISLKKHQALWEKHYPGLLRGGLFRYKRALFFSTSEKKVVKLDLMGKQSWKIDLGEDPGKTLVVEGKRVLVGTFRGKLYCLKRNDGKILWKYQTTNGITTVSVENKIVLVANKSKNLAALSLNDGKRKWHCFTADILQDSTFANGVLYAGTQRGNLCAYDLQKLFSK